MLAYVAGTAPILALRLDASMCVLNANAHARRILGEDPTGRLFGDLLVNFTPRPDMEALTATTPDGLLLSLQTAAEGPESFRFHFFPVPEGSLALGSPDVVEQVRHRVELLGLNRELSDLARQLHLANAELEELNRLKNQFLGMAAHDLRRPLGIMTMYAQFILDEAGAGLSLQHRDFLDGCLRSAADMKRLIDDFLDLAMIESGRFPLAVSVTRLADILGPVVELARLMADKKSIVFEIDVPDESREVEVDSPKIQQVLLNLIHNAVEHSPSGSRVRLSAVWGPDRLVLAVRDEGPGLSDADRDRLFAPFEQLAPRRTPGERHAGLGLAIAHKIVQAHRGVIRVESIPGQGATFVVTLPLLASPEVGPTRNLCP